MTFHARKIWLNVHLWLGLSLGLVFVLCGLTGSFLIFHRNIDERLNAGLMLTSNLGEPRPLAELVAAAQTAHPDLKRAQAVYLPRVANGTAYVRFKTGEKGKDEAEVDVFVDPITAQILGRRVHDSNLTAIIYQLHAKLLYGKTGETILGFVGLSVILSILSGVVLWWPLLKSGLRNAWAIRGNKFSYDLHKSVGGASAIVLFVIAVTGVVMIFADQLRPAAAFVSPVTKVPQKVESVVPDSKQPIITAERAVELAALAMPGSRLMSIDLPQGPKGSYRVSVRQANEVGELRGVGRIWIDQYSGEVLATRDWNTFTASDTFFRIQLALHEGDAFGIVGRWLFFIAGLMPAVLYVTGLMMWLRKKRAKKTHHRQTVKQGKTTPAAASAVFPS